MRKQHSKTSKAQSGHHFTKLPTKTENRTPVDGGDLPTRKEISPTISDTNKIRRLKMDHSPDLHKPIVLTDSYYEYSVFLQKFNVSDNTVKKWIKNGWLPCSKIDRMRYINSADIQAMMERFRVEGLGSH